MKKRGNRRLGYVYVSGSRKPRKAKHPLVHSAHPSRSIRPPPQPWIYPAPAESFWIHRMTISPESFLFHDPGLRRVQHRIISVDMGIGPSGSGPVIVAGMATGTPASKAIGNGTPTSRTANSPTVPAPTPTPAANGKAPMQRGSPGRPAALQLNGEKKGTRSSNSIIEWFVVEHCATVAFKC